ncbi:3-phosphoserine/phosphohydroxythreonine transaminase [Tichowtungia aerotolerans]|uniref:Phosphoserine aminotransferase n=1 Tax=Tichowtungia aerotolerans TaxID=2697043 RepID=A0A6P1M3V6_9BACT|nr:3-phosphoserine/phosphohydroxythreonine transaminase [Tichowtungia aerotolerans]QHI69529.1 3-phosphoserine/phosphohydroxythreonine transaminase [Tichowtungia aerotolerans]
MARAYNFSAGPAILPEEVLKQAQAELLDFNGTGMSIMEMSHRGKDYSAVHQEAKDNLKKLLNIPDNYSVLFMTGGASTQFSLIPMNLLGEGQTADYITAGAWSSKAIKAAKKLGISVNELANTAKDVPTRVPGNDLEFTPGAAYVHICSNETISGAQVKEFPKTDAPLIADMSSDILSRPLDVSQFGMIYAGAQKNLAPAGVTLVIIRNDLAEKSPDTLPELFQYKHFMENDSLSNTIPTFPVYMIMLVTRWLLEKGGLEGVQKMNEEKAAKLYAAIDASDFYNGTAVPEFRSPMNVTFRLPTEDLEAQFVKEAAAKGMTSLKGHRSVGGIRASIYNAFPAAGVDALIEFMKEFEAANA